MVIPTNAINNPSADKILTKKLNDCILPSSLSIIICNYLLLTREWDKKKCLIKSRKISLHFNFMTTLQIVQLFWVLIDLCFILLSSFMVIHHNDVTWLTWHLKSPATWLFVQQLVPANIKENIEARHYWPFMRGIHQSPVDFPSWWLMDSPHKGPFM